MPDKHLFLHVGTYKTGTTSIQNFLRLNRAALEAQGFYYPVEGMYYFPAESSQSLLAHAVLGRRPDYIGDVNFDLDTCIAEIRRDIQKSQCPKVIVSSEHFVNASTEAEVRRILAVFSGLVSKVTVVIYLRRQDTFFESIWSQQIKKGQITSSFAEYMATVATVDYFRYLEMLTRVVGHQNIVVRPYENLQLYKHDVVADFLNAIECDIHYVQESRENESPPTDLIELMRIFGKSFGLCRDREAFNQILRNMPIKIDTRRYALLSEQARSALIERYRESNGHVARKYLGRADGGLFLESETSALPIYPGMTLERFAGMSAQIITLLLKINNQLARKIRGSESLAH